MTNLNIKFIDEQDNDVTFDVLINDSQVNIAEIRVIDLSVDTKTMCAYVTTASILSSHHHQAMAVNDLLLWLIDSWDNQKTHGVVHRYLYDHLTDCFCGVLED